MFRQLPKSHAEQSFVLNAPAITVANACQDVLKSLGSIRSVNRQTGLIIGTIHTNSLTNDVVIMLSIYKEFDERTGVRITTERKEGYLNSGKGAQDGMAIFVQHLTQHPSMQGKSSSGW